MTSRAHLRRTRSASAAPRRQRSSSLRSAAAVTVLVALGATACSGGGDDMGASSSDSGGGTSAEAPKAAGDVDSMSLGGGGRKAADSAGRAARVGPLTRQVIRTGEVTVQHKDVPGLRDDVGRLVQRYGGYVSSEKSFTDNGGRLVEDRLVLRVPSDRYDDILAGFDGIGTVLSPTTKTEDVTTEVIDVDSRVRTAEVSVRRLRKFMGRSTDVDTLVRLESEVARREAELASLRAQQDYLQDQTSLATLTVTLQKPPPVQPGDDLDDGGFLAGLSGGWRALTGVLVVAVTVLGAVLPFALAAAVVGVPVALALRASRRRRPATPPPTAPTTPA